MRLTWSVIRLRAGRISQWTTPKVYFPRQLQTRTMASDVATMSDPPAPGQKVSQCGKIFTTVQEGRAYILVPDSAEAKDDKKVALVNNAGPVQQVFYNPIQQFNRDLTVLAIKAYGEEIVERKKEHLEKKLKKQADRRKRQAEKRNGTEAEKTAGENNTTIPQGDDRNKRKRDEDGEVGSNKLARPENVASPQDVRTNTEAVEEIGDKKVEVEDTMNVDNPMKQPTSNDSTRTETVAPEQQNGDSVEMGDDAAPDPNGQTNRSAEGEEAEAKEDSFKPHFTILDALSATGLRALRYAREIPFVTKVTANDLDPSATEAILRNVQHNKLEHAINVTQGNAIAHMYTKIAAHMALTEKERLKGRSEKYDVVDLDPYGTAANFFDAAVQAVRDDGGLLCVTCTDAGVWASNGYPEKAFALYGGVPVKGLHSHEVGLRLILNGIATTAARYGLSIEPLLSLSIDFYARVFVKVTKSPAAVKFAAGKTMVVYSCDVGCGAWTTQLLLKNRSNPNKRGPGTFYKHQASQGPTADQNCEHCGSKMHLAGPMYAGRLHNPDFIKRILGKLSDADKAVYGTTDRIRGMLTTALEEHLEVPDSDSKPKSQDDKYAEIEPYPFFFMPTQLARTVHCATPSEDAIRGALRGMGYRVTRSHCKPGSIKTDAPWSDLWHLMREWVRQKAPIKEDNIKPGSAGYRILKLGDGKKKPDHGEEKGGDSGAGAEVKDEKENDNEKEKEKKAEVVFDERLGREKTKEKLVRYQMNPRENWGPMNRATGQ